MKFIILLLMSNVVFFVFSEDTNIIKRIWANNKKQRLTELKYIEDNGILKIGCYGDVEININVSGDYEKQLIKIEKGGLSLLSFYSEYVINSFYLSGVYEIPISTLNTQAVLIVSYPVGASGLSANMTFGILIDIENLKYQYLSSWGQVNENFIDTNNTGRYDFISVDYHLSNNEPKLIANVFCHDASGFYVYNKSFLEDKVYVLFFNDFRIEMMDKSQNGIKFIKVPDILNKNKYILNLLMNNK